MESSFAKMSSQENGFKKVLKELKLAEDSSKLGQLENLVTSWMFPYFLVLLWIAVLNPKMLLSKHWKIPKLSLKKFKWSTWLRMTKAVWSIYLLTENAAMKSSSRRMERFSLDYRNWNLNSNVCILIIEFHSLLVFIRVQ